MEVSSGGLVSVAWMMDGGWWVVGGGYWRRRIYAARITGCCSMTSSIFFVSVSSQILQASYLPPFRRCLPLF